jgi:putative peptide zinc metalloprotease protein
VVPERAHRRLTTALRTLFEPSVVVAVLVGLVVIDVLLGLHHLNSISSGLSQVVAHPALLLAVVAMSLVTTAFHEIGHASAARYGGANPGVMGAGIYLAWPVFYTDVTDTYRLDRRGRLRTDLGGLYFNALTIVAAGAAYLWTGFGPLLVFVALVHLEVLNQFLPFVRLDGYWVVSDLIGVPNLFAYVRPVTAALLGRATVADRARLGQLKPRARRAIRLWVLATTVVVGVNAAFLGLFGPRLMSASVRAAAGRASSVGLDFGHLQFVSGLDNLLSLVLLALPTVGLAYLAVLLLRRALRTVRQWRLRPFAAAGVLGVCSIVASYQALSLSPGHRAVSPAAGLTAASQRTAAGRDASTTESPAGAASVMREAGAAWAAANSATAWMGASGSTTQPTSLPSPAAIPAPADAPSSAQAETEMSYVVQPGDTLWSIAAGRLGDPLLWQEIWTLNQGRIEGSATFNDPDLIWPGFVLTLPAQGEGVTPALAAPPQSSAAPGSSAATPSPGSPANPSAPTPLSLSALASAIGAEITAASGALEAPIGPVAHPLARPEGAPAARTAQSGAGSSFLMGLSLPWRVSLAVPLFGLALLVSAAFYRGSRRSRSPPL